MQSDCRFVLASPEVVKNINRSQQHIDWNLCYLCQQTKTNELLKNPVEYEATPQGKGRKYSAKDEYKKIEDIINKLYEADILPEWIKRDALDESDGIAETLYEKNAKHHSDCQKNLRKQLINYSSRISNIIC